MINSCKLLRKLLKADCVPIIGAYDGLVARAIAKNGFEACYVSGACVSVTNGVPDIGLNFIIITLFYNIFLD